MNADGFLGAAHFAAGGGELHLGKVYDLLAPHLVLVRLDLLSFEIRLQARKPGGLPLVFRLHLGADQSGQFLAPLDLITGANLECDRARRRTVQGGAYGCDDAPLDVDIPDQRSPHNAGCPDSVRRNAEIRSQPPRK